MKRTIFLATLIWLSVDTCASNTDWKFEFVDTFDNADNSANYGLNDNFGERNLFLYESRLVGISSPLPSPRWIRKAGSWYDKPVIREWWSQVNHPVSLPNQLSFHSELSAVMLDLPITPDVTAGSEYSITVTVNPVINSNSASEWASIMLDDSRNSRGWVTQTKFGFFIKADGQMALYQNGNSKVLNRAFIPPSEEYEVQLNIKDGSLVGKVNGYAVSASLDEDIPSTAYLYLGAYFENSGKVTTFDNLSIKTAKNATKNIQYYGYSNVIHDKANGETRNHLQDLHPALREYTNFNFINSVDFINDHNCQGKYFVVELFHKIWFEGTLRIDWESTWQNQILPKIKQYKNCIVAIYHMDEPFYVGRANPKDMEKVLLRVKQDLIGTGVRQFIMFAAPSVTANGGHQAPIMADTDFVAFNAYSSLAITKVNIQNLINNIKVTQPNKPIFLVPQTYFEGTSSDGETAAVNWVYYDLALNPNNKVKGMLNFGLWTGAQPSQVPLTLKVQKLIGRAILE